MPSSRLNNIPRAKSYTTILDLSKPASFNLFRNSPTNEGKNQSVFHASCGESAMKSLIDHKRYSDYVTCENYNLIKNESSHKTVVASTSTIFYDLDDIAKRHSFNCLTELSQSNSNLLKVMRMNVKNNAFLGKSNAIVQECATQIHPKLLTRDSIDINSKKVKRKPSRDIMLSSEIFLRDNDYVHDYERNYFCKDVSEKQHKIWSYAKYRTEYTKPIPEEKKYKKKDKGKRTDTDPCPCQLFSYACPCTDKKSLTELAKNSKSLTVTNQVTSTSNVLTDKRKDGKSVHKIKKYRHDMVREDKPTNTSVAELIEAIVPQNDSVNDVLSARNVQMPSGQVNGNKIYKPVNKFKSRKRSKKVLCPNCKEKVDVVISISTTEEEESLKCENSLLSNGNEIPSTTAYAYRATQNNHRFKAMEDDLCLHEPPCEMLPICQILPIDNHYYNVNQKCIKKNSMPKPPPRIIRITKACRHHPPCTVVPSCQRANVLKNNCEYIPPCMHRPRCVNLPLCVPFSKSLHYEEPIKMVDDTDNAECPHIPRCKYIPACQHDSLANLDNHQINMISEVQNTCEYFSDYNAPAFLLNPKSTGIRNTYSPCSSSTPCHRSRSNKSCQFDCSYYSKRLRNEDPNDVVVFIRDVGCQFRSKSYSPKGSVKSYSPINHSLLQSKSSSNSFEFVDIKQSNYYTDIHTLRYEDKFTNPNSEAEKSFSVGSITSVESECPSHGRRAGSRSKRPTTGFYPKLAYVAAFSTVKDHDPSRHRYKIKSKSNVQEFRENHYTFPVRSHRSFLRHKKNKKGALLKRRRMSRNSKQLINSNSTRNYVARE